MESLTPAANPRWIKKHLLSAAAAASQRVRYRTTRRRTAARAIRVAQ